MIKRVGKRGDTLIEVMLAVGIFSMVAVAVVAVMSGGTSSAQTALETTLAREEIDAQAEALRFIQSSYVSEKEGSNGKFAQLWQEITNPDHIIAGNDIKDAANYSPQSCADLYDAAKDNNIFNQKAFVINTHAFDKLTSASVSEESDIKKAIGEIYISSIDPDEKDLFQQTSTYPHLIFSEDTGSLVANKFPETFSSASGIYVIAVKDPSTSIVGVESGKKSAYYDFYIRTCWYGTGDKTPSTISTVIRLYDPNIVSN